MRHLVFTAFLMLSAINIMGGTSEDSSQDSTSLHLQDYDARIDSLAASIQFQHGDFILPGSLASVHAANGFAFLDAKNANTLLTGLWNNPPDLEVLGMLVPDDGDAASNEMWGIVYTYIDDGHVNDDDAEKIDYDELFTGMKESCEDENKEREKSGFESLHLHSWAQKPFYSQADHKLHWAKDIITGDDSIHILNYNIRMLGRKGVLVMNVVAGMEQLPMIKEKINIIMASTQFTSGNRYEDFNSGTDKIAEYGLAGLVAGAVLAKTGLFAKLGILLLKTWKIIAIGGIALIAAARKFWNKKKNV
jgi:uncharacterized membrane-anchored protein